MIPRLLTKKQADNRIQKYINENIFELFEHSKNKKKKKYYILRRNIRDNIWDILDDSIYFSDMEYEKIYLRYDTVLGNRVNVIIIPRFNKKQFLEIWERKTFEDVRETYMEDMSFNRNIRIIITNIITEEEFETIGTA